VSILIRGVRFAFPGLPQDLVFDGDVGGGELAGTVRQGGLRGPFSLRRAVGRIVSLLGAYRRVSGAEAAVVEPLGVPPILVELPSGATHGIGPSLGVSRRLGDHGGDGRLAPDATGRIAVRQRGQAGSRRGHSHVPAGS
jgi:hypothetical protein